MTADLLSDLTPEERRIVQAKKRGTLIAFLILMFSGLVIILIFTLNAPYSPSDLWEGVLLSVLGFATIVLGIVGFLSGTREVNKFLRSRLIAKHSRLLDSSGRLREDYSPMPVSVMANPSPQAKTGDGEPSQGSSSSWPCPYCGTWNDKEFSFCLKCGKGRPGGQPLGSAPRSIHA